MGKPSTEALKHTLDWIDTFETDDDASIYAARLREMAVWIGSEILRRECSEHLDANRDFLEATALPKDSEGRPLITWSAWKRKALVRMVRAAQA